MGLCKGVVLSIKVVPEVIDLGIIVLTQVWFNICWHAIFIVFTLPIQEVFVLAWTGSG